MLQVKVVSTQDIDYTLHNLIHWHSIHVELPDTELAKHYSGSRLAHFLTDFPQDFMYVLYEDQQPIGLWVLDASYPIHMDCLCVCDQLLFILEDKRSLKTLRSLVLGTLAALAYRLHEPFLVSVGSTLGKASLPAFYKRIGFVEAGTQLVKEYP